ncbi:rhodanese-like domain-containing protein [Allopusillimonas ginsengisoli]|uniref:rhodanese-like domain-containing protein n=1 Tax=Allopusillimonas ginsengisoli TaxID=453575 RepID=UPI00142FF248|nr:rhodanese-like domain-containing protein [Allopusillimonas ginsengisoli]
MSDEQHKKARQEPAGRAAACLPVNELLLLYGISLYSKYTIAIAGRDMKRIHLLMAALLLSFYTNIVLAAAPADIPKDKQTHLGLYLSPQQAWDKIQENPSDTLFIDVRTRAEAVYVGMPEGVDGLVPYVEHDPFWSWDDKRNTYKVEPVQSFVPEVNRRLEDKKLSKNDTVIVMCRSGTRSALAADRLAEDGYTKVYTIVEGFEGDKRKSGPDKGQRTMNGWKNAGLPWTYAVQKEKMFIEGED